MAIIYNSILKWISPNCGLTSLFDKSTVRIYSRLSRSSTARGSSTGLVTVGPNKIISQFCQIVNACYWNVDRLFQNDKRVLNFIKQVFFLLSAEGSLVDIRAYIALHLSGTPSQETSSSPPSCLLLDNLEWIFIQSKQIDASVDWNRSCFYFQTIQKTLSYVVHRQIVFKLVLTHLKQALMLIEV